MKTLNNFILERLKLSKNSKLAELIKFDDTKKPKKQQFTTDEITDIQLYANQMTQPPTVIKLGIQGNIKLVWEENIYVDFGKNRQFWVNISKPDRYHGSFKITMPTEGWSNYEYPIGANYSNKDGSLKLPNVETTIKKADEYINKHNLLTRYYQKK